MPEFLVEVYLSRAAAAAGQSAAGARQGRQGRQTGPSPIGGSLPVEGVRARLVFSVAVPDEEICFYLFEAGSIDDADKAARSLGLHPERVVGVVAEWAPSPAEVDLRESRDRLVP
jgi:hypothetical protein